MTLDSNFIDRQLRPQRSEHEDLSHQFLIYISGRRNSGRLSKVPVQAYPHETRIRGGMPNPASHTIVTAPVVEQPPSGLASL